MNINSPIRLSTFDDPKKLSEMSDRNFTSVWQALMDILSRLIKIEKKNTPEVISANTDSITLMVGGKNYKIKVEV